MSRNPPYDLRQLPAPAESLDGREGDAITRKHGKSDSIGHLKQRLLALERRQQLETVASARTVLRKSVSCSGAWSFGDQSLDDSLTAAGLDTTALYEIKAEQFGDWPAALGLALRLTVRRFAGLASKEHRRPVLWCQSASSARETGRLYTPGLLSLGLSPDDFIIVETTKIQDALWALEEGLRSGSTILAVGCIGEIGLTESRRLALAAGAAETPCLLLSSPRSASVPSTSARWRVSRIPSACHPFDGSGIGATRFRLSLERCRGKPLLPENNCVTVEWCDAALRFRVATGVADRTAQPSRPRLRAG